MSKRAAQKESGKNKRDYVLLMAGGKGWCTGILEYRNLTGSEVA